MIKSDRFHSGLAFTVTTYEDAVRKIVCTASKRSRTPICVYTPNVHHYYLYCKNKEFKNAYDDVDISLVDGMPLVWLLNLKKKNRVVKISGSDIVLDLFHKAVEENLTIYILGGADGVGEKAVEKMGYKGELNKLIYLDSPEIGFEKDSRKNRDVINKINKVKPDIVFVALGAPKQELWIYKYKKDLKTSVLMGVGGSFDFVAGVTQRAPVWLQKCSLEWLYRLLKEPRRLWRRYLVTNTYFIFDVVRMFLKRK